MMLKSFLSKMVAVFLLTIGTFMALSPVLYALPQKQRDLILSGARYFDVEYACGSGEGNKNVYVLGDSLTVGMRDDGNLESKLQDVGWDQVTIEATGGDTIADALPKAEADRATIEASSAVVISLGTNTEENLRGKITQMVDKVREFSDTTTIYWTNIFTADAARNAEVNDAINDRSEAMGFDVIDWAAEVGDTPGRFGFSEDGVHHTPAGYTTKAEFMAESVAAPTSATVDAAASVEEPGAGGPDAGAANIQKITPAPFPVDGAPVPIEPTAVVLHWTGGNPNQSVESFISGIAGRGLDVQLYIDGSGNVYQLVDDLATLTAHATRANSKGIGIEIAAGSDGTVATAEREINANQTQKQAVATTVAFLVEQYGMQIDPDVANIKGILSHHIIQSEKSDVGDTYHEEIIEAVRSGGFGQVNACEEDPVGGDGGTPDENKQLGQSMAAERGWNGGEWSCLLELWTRESGWEETKINDAEGNNDLNGNIQIDPGETISETEDDAYGIPQSKPGGKMATAGADWRNNARTQITWGLDYIADRYVTPCQALDFHNANNYY